jgi:hypothetical protein
MRSRVLLSLLFLAPLCSDLHAQSVDRDPQPPVPYDSLFKDAALYALYHRATDSLWLIKKYGPQVPVGDILQTGYRVVAIGEGTSPGDSDDTIYLFAPRSRSSGWVRGKSITGYDQGLVKVEAKCQENLLKMGEYSSFTEVAPGTIGQAILNRICRRGQGDE